MTLYRLYCEICEWKRTTDGTDVDDLVEVKTALVPGGMPTYDEKDKETKFKKSKPQPRKFKCPNCGRIVIPRKLSVSKEEKNEDRLDGSEAGSERP